MGKTGCEVISMAKQGMKRPDVTHTQPKNQVSPVPEVQGKAKSAKAKAKPIVTGTSGPEMKVFHRGEEG